MIRCGQLRRVKMSDPGEELKEKTQRTAELYFRGFGEERPFELWRSFDRDLARDLSLFITGKLYAREKIPHTVRQLVAVAALTVLERTEELKLHLYGALNVGCDPKEIAEVIFQMVPYAGIPVVNSALKVLRTVLKEKGLWPLYP